jgi:hypothetical protein
MELRKAALVLSDISGYTNFLQLHTMSLLHAEKIITELMEAVIDASRHPLQLYKLQGDSLLFYAFAESTDNLDEHREIARDVLDQSLAFFDAFRNTADQLIGCNVCPCDACRQVGDLHLKSILHFGEVAFKKVRGFEELAGEEVILTHRLAKNSIPVDEYLMLTKQFHDLSGGGEREVEFESRTEDCAGIGQVPIMVYYPSPAPPPSPRKLIPTLYTAARLDGYGFLRTMGLKDAPEQRIEAAYREACEVDDKENLTQKPARLGNFLRDCVKGLAMVLRPGTKSDASNTRK